MIASVFVKVEKKCKDDDEIGKFIRFQLIGYSASISVENKLSRLGWFCASRY